MPEHIEQTQAGSGYVWIPEEAHEPPQRYDWQTDLQSDRRCRYKGCGRRAVAKLMRPNGWWHYCDQHLYGRRIVGTTIERRVAVGSPAHTNAVYWKEAGLDA